MTHYKRWSVYLATAAAMLTPLIPILPDGAPMSPRSILTAIIAGLVAGSVILRGFGEAEA